MRVSRSHPVRRRRCGAILVPTVLLLTALLGMIGLVIDGGLMMAAKRVAQNAADAGAMAAALELERGNTVANAKTMATTFVQTYNNMPSATVTTNIPPSTGPHSTITNANNYAEVIVNYPISTFFMGVLGITSNTVKARAVAGFEPVGNGEGSIVLDPTAQPGLSVQGGAILQVNGDVVVNSSGPGIDQYGNSVSWPGFVTGQPALVSGNNSTIQAQYIQVHGGVDTPANYQSYPPGGPSPLFAGNPLIEPDPLNTLAVPQPSNTPSIPAAAWTTTNPNPTTGTGGVITYPSAVYTNGITINSGQTVVLNPGVFADITINSGTNVTFNAGVYILSPQKPNQGMSIAGGSTVTASSGVLFYATGSDYMPATAGAYTPGAFDAADAAVAVNPPATSNAPSSSNLPTLPGVGQESNNVIYARITVTATGGTVLMNPLNDASNTTFNGILFYQRRRDTNVASITGNSGPTFSLNGTIYARWGQFKLAGGGKYNAQFVVGSMSISGQAAVTINFRGKNFGTANEVFLVE